LAHGQETADHIREYIEHMDERGVVLNPPAEIDLQVTTLHGIAYSFIPNEDEGIVPLSLDGSEGRQWQMLIIKDIVRRHVAKGTNLAGCRDEFAGAFRADLDSEAGLAFCCDLMDEFANTLETLGERNVDQIAERYLRARFAPQSLARQKREQEIVLELYRDFRSELAASNVMSLDQFIVDFSGYLNSFRWATVREKKGFDFVFADELHLFNKQERPVLAYLTRDPTAVRRVAVAYDPRQSPRNSFFPSDQSKPGAIWSEAGISDGARQFELTDVFRYSPEIMEFMKHLNSYFPADDFSEEWQLRFGQALAPAGSKPHGFLHADDKALARVVSERAVALQERGRRLGRGHRTAVLCMDPDRYVVFRKAGWFSTNDFVTISSRDEIGQLRRYRNRVVLSTPEYVAGLQFENVLLVDANARLVGKLGLGPTGEQRFISAAYLGASRAKALLEIHADSGEGGFAQHMRDAFERGIAKLSSV
jgi:hypothetical protein